VPASIDTSSEQTGRSVAPVHLYVSRATGV